MTRTLFRDDAYLREAPGTVIRAGENGGIVLDASLFYPQGGGQPGDGGWLAWDGREIAVNNAVKGEGDEIVLLTAAGAVLPEAGQVVTQQLDWNRRYSHMRLHTALHLLSVVIPLPVTGGQIGTGKGRLDFDMPEAPQGKDGLQAQLQALIARDLAVTEDWITDAEFEANPGLVKTMSVKPPVGAGQVRLVRIGAGEEQIDLQPCGGTHVARLAEIGAVRLGKIEKKGARNRRVYLQLA